MAIVTEARPMGLGLKDRIGRLALDTVMVRLGVENDRRKISGNITEGDRTAFISDTQAWITSLQGNLFNGSMMKFVNKELRALDDLSNEALDKHIKLRAHVSLQDKGFSCLLLQYRFKAEAYPSHMEEASMAIPA